MPKKSKAIIYLEYFAALPFLLFPTFFPLKISLWSGKMLGLFCYYILGNARNIAIRNLSLAFKDKYTLIEKKNIVRKVFINMGYTAFELLNFKKLKPSFFDTKVRFINFESVEKALQQNKGVIICTAHLFNWEIAAAAVAHKGNRVNAIVRLLDNPLLDKYVENFRIKKGINIIPKQYALKRGIKALRSNQLLAILVDQNAAVNGEFVPFFNIPASTMRGAAFFHKVTDAPVVCGYQLRQEDGSHIVGFSDILPMTKDITRDLTIIMNFYEKIITENPSHWLWLHPRWKKRPPGEKGFYSGLKV